MLKKQFFAIIILCSISFNKTEDQKKRPRSALKWISKYEAKNLPGSWWDDNLVHGRHSWITYCRTEVDGCFYPGEAYLGDNNDGYPECRPITKEKVYPPKSNYDVLYNPNGVSNYAWRPWPKGTDNLNFPLGVVKSDDSCNLMIGRYQDYGENALIDGEGYVYYQHGPGEGWYWDNDEYDIMVERSVKKIELLELDYKEPINRKTSRFEGEGDRSTSKHLLINRDNTETEISASLSMAYTDQKSWSHSVSFSIKFGVDVEVTSPGKALLGGAGATYKFEKLFSYSHGWGGGNARSREASQSVTKNVPPKHRIRVKMFMMQNIVDVPYTAKYRITYEDGSTKVVNDEGVMKNVFYSDSQVEVGEAEPI